MTHAFRATLEDVREFWNRRPCNIRHSVKPTGTREYFEEVEHRKYLVEPHIPEFAAVFTLAWKEGPRTGLRNWY